MKIKKLIIFLLSFIMMTQMVLTPAWAGGETNESPPAGSVPETEDTQTGNTSRTDVSEETTDEPSEEHSGSKVEYVEQILKAHIDKDHSVFTDESLTAEVKGKFPEGATLTILAKGSELHLEFRTASKELISPESFIFTIKTEDKIGKITDEENRNVDFTSKSGEYRLEKTSSLDFTVTLAQDEEQSAEEEISETDIPAESADESTDTANSEGSEGAEEAARPHKAPSLRAEGETAETYNIIINYIFSDNSIAYDPFVATVEAGASYDRVVTLPVLPGYEANYNDQHVLDVHLSYSDIQENKTITVTYKPIPVTYQVRHYWQNADNDNYSLHEIEEKEGYTGDPVEDAEKVYEGFAVLAYEHAAIAADGSTVIEVRYDREYSLIKFDLDGGYGVDPIYAKWGSTLDVGTPRKIGHAFAGWDHEIPDKMPYGGDTFKASWTAVGSLYNIIYWKENADDDGYSYWGSELRSAQTGSVIDGSDTLPTSIAGDDFHHFVFNDELTDKGVVIKGDGTSLVNVYYDRKEYTITLINASGNDYICGFENHTHSYARRALVYYGGCYPSKGVEDLDPDLAICGHEEHHHTYDRRAYVYTGGCYPAEGSETPTCGKEEHAHTTACYTGATTTPAGYNARNSLNRNYDQVNGSIGEYGWFGTTKYIYINGTWYEYTGSASTGTTIQPSCGKEEHSHSYSSRVYKYYGGCYPEEGALNGQTICGKEEHTHIVDGRKYQYYGNCYPEDGADEGRYSCGLEEHQHTSSCRGTLIHRITAKYGADISDQWEFDGLDGNHYPQTSPQVSSWYPVESSIYSQRLYDIQTMPGEHSIFRSYFTSNSMRTYLYYVETLPGETAERTVDGTGYKLHYTLNHDFNYWTRAEDYYEFDGFTQKYAKNSSGTTITGPRYPSSGNLSSGETLYMYYARNKYRIDYQSNGETLTRDADGNSLTSATYTKIPYELPLNDYNITPPYPENFQYGAYTFAGWYDNANYAGHPFSFDSQEMPSDNLILFAKWVPTKYTVRLFQDRAKAEEGTAPLETREAFYGEILDAPEEPEPEEPEYIFIGWFYNDGGVEKPFTFGASTITRDLDLYAKWSSNTIRPYTVYYTDPEGNELAPPTTGSAYAGTTKTFPAKDLVPLGYFPRVQSHSILIDIKGTATNGLNDFTFIYDNFGSIPYTVHYMDARTHEKLLPDKVVSSNTKVSVTEKFSQIDGYVPDAFQKKLIVAVGADNEITFWYTKDSEHAFYLTSHYIENPDGTWTLYNDMETYSNIGETVTARPMDIPGYYLDTTVPGTVSSGVVTAAGLEMKLYYLRNQYPYKVRYIDSRTGLALHEEKRGSGKVDTTVTEEAEPITGYDCINGPVLSKVIQIEDDPNVPVRNVITFYYQVQQAEFKYIPVGNGSVDNAREFVAAYAGTALGSTATADERYRFDGWYKDEACTIPVQATDGTVSGNKFTPSKQGDRYFNGTFYAKFVKDDVTLPVEKRGTDGVRNLAGSFSLYKEGGSEHITYSGHAVNVSPDTEITTPGSVVLEKNSIYYLVEAEAPANYSAWNGSVRISVDPAGNITVEDDDPGLNCAALTSGKLILYDHPVPIIPTGVPKRAVPLILVLLGFAASSSMVILTIRKRKEEQ